MSDLSEFGRHIREFLGGLLELRTPPREPAEKRPRLPGSFPESEETEYERSTLMVPIFKGTELVEELKLKALLKLRRLRPSRTATGLRQIEFLIDEWEVAGESAALGKYVSYSLSDTKQPKSVCVANQADSDFPATIFYSAIYDLYIGDERILEKIPGVGIGSNVTEIPPRNLTVAFDKPFQLPGADDMTAAAGRCIAMESLTEAEFAAQAAGVRALRAPGG